MASYPRSAVIKIIQLISPQGCGMRRGRELFIGSRCFAWAKRKSKERKREGEVKRQVEKKIKREGTNSTNARRGLVGCGSVGGGSQQPWGGSGGSREWTEWGRFPVAATHWFCPTDSRLLGSLAREPNCSLFVVRSLSDTTTPGTLKVSLLNTPRGWLGELTKALLK